MLLTSIAELCYWFFWEFLLCYILYSTGALVIRLATFGRVKNPLYSPADFNNEKRLARSDFFSDYIAGFFFYLILLTSVLWFG